MPNVKLFEFGCTRNIRFSSRDILDAYLNGDNYSQYEAEGCNITNTSSYIDIKVPTTYPLFAYSYLQVLNGEGEWSYLGFIDRIEPNNFNDGSDNRWYRIYFTVDWWSTIMHNDSSDTAINMIKRYLEGNVERAHVNDIFTSKKDDKLHKGLIYTTPKAEFGINKYYNVISNRINNGGVRRFAWILYAPSGTFNSVDFSVVGDRIIPYNYKLLILPLFQTRLIYDFYTGEEHLQSTVAIGSYNILPSSIDDSKVISIYVTDYCPNYDGVNITIDVASEAELDQISQNTQSISISGGTAVAFSIPRNVNRLYIESEKYTDSDIPTFKTYVNISEIDMSNPTNEDYENYLNNIAKIDFCPYTVTVLCIDNESVVLRTDKINNRNLFEYVVSPVTGGYYFYFNYDLFNPVYADENYELVSSGGVFQPMSLNDEFTALTRQSIALQGIGSILNILSTKTSQTPVGNIVSNTSSVVDVYRNYNIKKIFGEKGFDLCSNALGSYTQPPMVVVYKPIESEMKMLKKDLALYGYNTYLHPHEVLEGHKRKYFNYIKTNNARLNTPLFNAEIRLQIEEMFNNGVWLWNTLDNYGIFEVPNYPIILEEIE